MDGRLFEQQRNENSNKRKKSEWCSVKSGVPQGSVLAPMMFLVYVNYMTEGVNSCMSLLGDDAKLLRKIESKEDCEHLQKDLDKIHRWSKLWEMEFNAKKCKVLEIGCSRMKQRGKYSMGNEWINKMVKKIWEYGLEIICHLRNILILTGDTYQQLRNTRMAFKYLDEEMINKLITLFIQPKLEYAAMIWSPHKKDTKKLESRWRRNENG